MLDLAGHWELSDFSGEYSVPLTLPGDAISALHEAGAIPDPYWGRNEYDLRWIADRDWVAKRRFTVECDRPVWTIFADGLDCVADIRINGAKVLTASNAFRPHEADVSNHIRVGENEIEILFRSNTAEADARQAAQPFPVPVQSSNSPIPNGNMLRKVQCDFGWDWNIALAPFGLYGAVRLCGMQTTDLRDVNISQYHRDGAVDLTICTNYRAFAQGEVPYRIQIDGKQIEGFVSTDNSTGTFAVQMTIDAPRLWWPNGLGNQDTYDLTISLGDQSVTKKIALRDVRLHADKDEIGRSFRFSVNSVDVFAKGANWIPADALAGRITPEATADLLKSAAEANMNMIRVWGGGRYEADWFYEYCDEFGLLVWQDYMFACNLYPCDDEFLEDVAQEVQHQTFRLNHHVALWCGDNELIGALTWFEESRKDRDRYLVAYDRLNRTIETAMKSTVSDANWWPSSPSPGPLSFGDAWHDDSSGDMHFWSVWHEGRDFEHYRDVQPRFCSEFGFQSFPSMSSLRTFADQNDLNIASPVMESHQKNAGGNARIAETMFRNFRFPQRFADFVYLSQIQQGIAIKTAVDYWRSLRPVCMGALYWQLNDTWPVASWSSLNYGGSWKALHYMARQFFAPVQMSIIPGDDVVAVFGLNDTRDDVEVSLTLERLDCDGKRTELSTGNHQLFAGQVSRIETVGVNSFDGDAVLLATMEDGQGNVSIDTHSTRPFKEMSLNDPLLTHSVEIVDGQLRHTLTVEKPAFFVVLDCDVAGRFSENVLTLLPGQPKTITFTPVDPADLVRAHDTTTVNNLYSATCRPNSEVSS